jgi:hypothetical protein
MLFLPWSLHYLSADVTASVVELAKSRGRFGLAPKALGVRMRAAYLKGVCLTSSVHARDNASSKTLSAVLSP